MSKKLWILSLFCASFTTMLGLWVAYHFLMLIQHGSVVISEPDLWIAIPEFAFTLVIIAIALYTWLKLVRG